MNDIEQPLATMFLGILGTACFLGLWEIIGQLQLAGLSWPPLTDVVALLFDPSKFNFYSRALIATLKEAISGYVVGASAGFIFAVIAHLVPPLDNGLSRFAAVINSIPSIALAPIFLILLSRESAPAAVASIHVLFIVFVSCSSGLKMASETQLDLFTVFGAPKIRRFVLLEFPIMMPPLMSGLRLSVPVALIGAIIGEWFGATRGIGVLIVNAMQNFQIPLLWSAVLLAATSSLIFYLVLTVLERRTYAKYR